MKVEFENNFKNLNQNEHFKGCIKLKSENESMPIHFSRKNQRDAHLDFTKKEKKVQTKKKTFGIDLI